jgi:hypothetical protein
MTRTMLLTAALTTLFLPMTAYAQNVGRANHGGGHHSGTGGARAASRQRQLQNAVNGLNGNQTAIANSALAANGGLNGVNPLTANSGVGNAAGVGTGYRHRHHHHHRRMNQQNLNAMLRNNGPAGGGLNAANALAGNNLNLAGNGLAVNGLAGNGLGTGAGLGNAAGAGTGYRPRHYHHVKNQMNLNGALGAGGGAGNNPLVAGKHVAGAKGAAGANGNGQN